MNSDTADLDWYRRIRDNHEVAAVAVICDKCWKPISDIEAVQAGMDARGNCRCNPPEDYNKVIEAHGLGLFTSIFKYILQEDEDTFKSVREHA